MVYEVKQDLFSTSLEPEDVSPGESPGKEPLLEAGRLLSSYAKPLRIAGALYVAMMWISILAGLWFAWYLVTNYTSIVIWVTGSYALSVILIAGVVVTAYRRRGIFDELDLFVEGFHEDISDLNFEMTRPAGDTTGQRIANQLRRSGYYADKLDTLMKKRPEALVYDSEVEGTSGKKYTFDVLYHYAASPVRRLLKVGSFLLLVKIFEREVTEDDLEEVRDASIDVSKRLGYIPDQVVVVSRAGFTRLAYGWANREANEITLDENDPNAWGTAIELVQETPAGTFKIVV